MEEIGLLGSQFYLFAEYSPDLQQPYDLQQ
jgi:hypothetical protein